MAVTEFDISILANPTIFEQNRLKQTSDHKFYANENELLESKSSLVKSLNGRWHFHFAKNLNGRPCDFFKTDFDDSHFDYIEVPGHFETQGFGRPHYTNIAYPWEGKENVKPGQIPTKHNPVGSYITFFEKPQNFENTFISFKGVDSAFAIWVNGNYVGYSEDSCTPADFDITKYVVDGKNKLAVQVFKYSSGSWLEDQDFFRFSGIFRDVEIYTKPKLHLNDIFVKTNLLNNYTKAKITLDLDFLGEGTANIILLDREQEVFETNVKSTDNKVEFELDNPKLWSAEKPNLYTLVLMLKDNLGNLVEVASLRVGIKEFKLINNIMCINGKRIVFNGVNRHEFYPESGRVCTDVSKIYHDLLIMKDLNINAVRTSHYPNNSAFYEFCDELGLYVIDETNIETHGTWMSHGVDMVDSEYIIPHNKKEWEKAVLARGESMLERDKNHACIVIYSCGNESFGGSCLFKLSEYFRQRDPSRLVHYEGIFHDRSYNKTSDMESQMYTNVANVKRFIKEHNDKPFIMCEYSHAMGNSNGGMKLYTDLSHDEPLFQGGFIWDFVDQALYTTTDDGIEYLAYGGDFDDRPNDANFAGNGILLADRSYTPKCAEVKFNYQPFKLDVKKDGVTITNYNLFTNLNEYDVVVSLKVNGELVLQDYLDNVSCEPGETTTISFDKLNLLEYQNQGSELVITVSIQRVDKISDLIDSQVAFGQYVIGEYVPNVKPKAKLELVDSVYNIGIVGENFSYMFSKGRGTLISALIDGQEVLKSPMKLNFFRAPTDNDFGNGMPSKLGAWKLASDYHSCALDLNATSLDYGIRQSKNIPTQVIKTEDGYKISFTHILGGTTDVKVKLEFLVDNSGTLTINSEYKKNDKMPNLVEFGVLFKLKSQFDQIEYYGKGPFDGYVDRDNGLELGTYQSTTYDEFVPYLIPQECGNHTQTRFVKITNNKGHGIEFVKSEDNFSFSALPFTPNEIENASHIHELPNSYTTVVKLSSKHMGVGGDDSWGAPVLEQYQLPNQDLKFSIKLNLI